MLVTYSTEKQAGQSEKQKVGHYHWLHGKTDGNRESCGTASHRWFTADAGCNLDTG